MRDLGVEALLKKEGSLFKFFGLHQNPGEIGPCVHDKVG
jgi:hypothetical protein